MSADVPGEPRQPGRPEGAEPARPPRRGRRARACVTGLVIGTLSGVGAERLGLGFGIDHFVALSAVAGAIVALILSARPVWVIGGCVAGAWLLVAYTPTARVLMDGMPREDVLQPAPAVVVLSSFVFKDQTLSSAAQERIVRGYEVLHSGYAPRLVLTAASPPAGAWEQPVRRQMNELGLEFPIDVVGPVRNTHDEAVLVADLARKRGWNRVILVTHPWHMRRAAAAFEKAGIRVICSPCADGSYDLRSLDDPGDRIGAFRRWLHETIGYWAYRRRGWV